MIAGIFADTSEQAKTGGPEAAAPEPSRYDARMKPICAASFAWLALLSGLVGAQERVYLLVATNQITEEAFSRTVILLLHYGSDGAIGVAINRPTWVTTDEVFPNLGYLHAYRGHVFHGGPLAQTTVLVLHRSAAAADDEPLVDGVYMSSELDWLEADFDARKDTDSALRFYAGHASWRPGQLEEELSGGAWRVVPGGASEIFDAEPTSLWRRLNELSDQLSVEERPLAPAIARGEAVAGNR